MLVGTVLLIAFVVRPGNGELSRDRGGKVLIVNFLDDDKAAESFGLFAFKHAMMFGGRVDVTTEDLKPLLLTTNGSEDSRFVVSSPKGTYFPEGSLVNYITSQGWRFHSHDVRSLYYFVRD